MILLDPGTGHKNRALALSILLASTILLCGSQVDASEDLALQELQRRIVEKGYHWTAGQTSVSAESWESFETILTLRMPLDYERIPKIDYSRLFGKMRDIPEQWDWRDHQGTTPVRDQANCGSCWAFAAVGALEGCARIVDGLAYDLSEQQLLSCNRYGYGCDGGWWDGCFELFHTTGVIADACMPYLASDLVPCEIGECEILSRASEMIPIENNIRSIQAAVYQYGPIVSGMTVYPDFRYYTDGCYQRDGSQPINHGIVIVGWDNQACSGHGAWICKNSWGTGWGDAGWFMIRYGDCRIGEGATLFIPEPGRVITVETVPIETTTDGSCAFVVEVELHSKTNSPIDPGSAILDYRVNHGEWYPIPLEPGNRPGRWTAEIPGCDPPAAVDYYIAASDLDGRQGTSPATAPDSCHSFDVARVWESFDKEPQGWRVGDRSDHATSGIWEWCEPIGTEAQPGVDHSVRGTHCWVTGQQIEGGATGDNDVDGGRTTLYSPGYELSGSATAIVKYWRWYSNDRGASPSEDIWCVQVRNQGGDWIDLERTTKSGASWAQIERDLHEWIGSDLGVVEFRFIAADEPEASCVEAAIDDFAILAEARILSDAKAAPKRSIVIGQPRPHPLTTGSTITVTGLFQWSARVEIYGPNGRFVRRLVTGIDGPGGRSFYWDGRDETGRRVAAGSYFTRLAGGSSRATGMILVVR